MVTGVFSIPLAPAGRPADFIVGQENRLVGLAVAALAQGVGDYNPLVLCGGPGSGKSHLARGLAARWPRDDRRPSGQESVVLYDAVTFCRELARLRQRRILEAWRTRLRGAELLVIEDVHLLHGHATAACELAATIDELLSQGGQLIATTRLAPAALPGVEAALRSRLAAGLVIALAPPQLSARLALVRAFADRHAIALDDGAVAVLAAGLSVSAGEIDQALDRLALRLRGATTPVSPGLARACVGDFRRQRHLEMGAIAGRVARRYRLKVADLRGPSRRRSVAAARSLTMYLCRELSGRSLQRIGNYLGGRDHSTVLHGCQKTERLMTTDASIRTELAELRAELELEGSQRA